MGCCTQPKYCTLEPDCAAQADRPLSHRHIGCALQRLPASHDGWPQALQDTKHSTQHVGGWSVHYIKLQAHCAVHDRPASHNASRIQRLTHKETLHMPPVWLRLKHSSSPVALLSTHRSLVLKISLKVKWPRCKLLSSLASCCLPAASGSRPCFPNAVSPCCCRVGSCCCHKHAELKSSRLHCCSCHRCRRRLLLSPTCCCCCCCWP